MQTFTLKHGVEIPALGFGVYSIPTGLNKQAVLEALNVGVRHIDTAQSYMNEAEVGEALADTQIPRDKIFLTTQIWLRHYGYEATDKSVEATLNKSTTDYLDLVLLHTPVGDVFGSLQALADHSKAGKIRAIGVYNLHSERLADIVAFTDAPVTVHTIEIHPLDSRETDLMNAQARGLVLLEAWAPFAEGKDGILDYKTLTTIGKKYGQSAATDFLRWNFERGIDCLDKSVQPERMETNIDIFDFALTHEDKATIATLDTHKCTFFELHSPDSVDMFVKFLTERDIVD